MPPAREIFTVGQLALRYGKSPEAIEGIVRGLPTQRHGDIVYYDDAAIDALDKAFHSRTIFGVDEGRDNV